MVDPSQGGDLSASTFAAASTPADVPGVLAEPRAVTTGPDGKATLDYLARPDKGWSAVRIAADRPGRRTSQLIDEPGRGTPGNGPSPSG